jgi:hypothetical protein
MEFYEAYSFQRDREYIERLQAATVQQGEFALRSDNGLVGSKAWWEAVRDETIPTSRVEGEIVDIRLNAGSWPEFEVDSDGVSSTWCLEGDIKSYCVGGKVRVEYVMVRYAKPPSEDDDAAKIVTGIWVET